jgi:uncharacterized membrane protein YgcG
MRKLNIATLALLLAGCGSYTAKPESFVLPTSNKSIDVVLHRSDVRLMDCSTLTVIQTYDATAKLIDAQAARGSALHCVVIPSLIEAGGRVGAGAIQGAASTVIRNVNQQAQGQIQSQSQGQSQNAQGGQGGNGGNGGNGGQGGQGGNNGGGNGSDDGTNPGTDNHNDNGDND